MSFLSRFIGGVTPGGASNKRIIFSYVFDYVVIVVLLLVFLGLDAIEPFHQEFSLHNFTLQYKFAVKERVPNAALVTIAVGAPIIIIALWTMVIDGIFSHKVNGQKQKYTLKERLWELNCGWLGLGLSIALQYVIVASLKNAIGKPRPDLIDRCQPKDGSADPLPFGLSNHEICTQGNAAILKDGFRSFPSGHSSTAFGGLFYLTLFIAAKLHILDSRGEVWKLFVAMGPSLGAALIAGSRIMDARHHPFDVLSGSLIGILFAWAAYRQYFPPVTDAHAKGRAYPMRTWGGEPLGSREKETLLHQYQQPAAQDEEQPGQGASTAVRPPGSATSGNFFRDEVHASQRQRRFDRAAYEPNQQRAPSISPPASSGASTAARHRQGDRSVDLSSRSGVSADTFEMQPPPFSTSQQFSPQGPRATPAAFGRYDTYDPPTVTVSHASPVVVKSPPRTHVEAVRRMSQSAIPEISPIMPDNNPIQLPHQ